MGAKKRGRYSGWVEGARKLPRDSRESPSKPMKIKESSHFVKDFLIFILGRIIIVQSGHKWVLCNVLSYLSAEISHFWSANIRGIRTNYIRFMGREAFFAE